MARGLVRKFKILAALHDCSLTEELRLAAIAHLAKFDEQGVEKGRRRKMTVLLRAWRPIAAVLALLLLVAMLLPAPHADADPPYRLRDDNQLTDTAHYLSSEGVATIKGEQADLYDSRQIRLFVAIIKRPSDPTDSYDQGIAAWAAATATASGLHGGTDCLLVLSPGPSYGAPGSYALWPASSAGSPIDRMLKEQVEPAVRKGTLGTAPRPQSRALTSSARHQPRPRPRQGTPLLSAGGRAETKFPDNHGGMIPPCG